MIKEYFKYLKKKRVKLGLNHLKIIHTDQNKETNDNTLNNLTDRVRSI